MENLVFFDTQGESINAKYKAGDGTWEANLLFSANSSDTHKTEALYVFEKLAPFQYDADGSIVCEKIQLFNENDNFRFSGGTGSARILGIKPANASDRFFSKWIYGTAIEQVFPRGSEIRLSDNLVGLSKDQSYRILGTKQNHVLIVGGSNNYDFVNAYGTNMVSATYSTFTASWPNTFCVSGYMDENSQNLLSNWSEPNFYSDLFAGRKINIVGTDRNDGVYTIKDLSLADCSYVQKWVDITELQPDSDLVLEVESLTDALPVYSGPVELLDDKVFFGQGVPNVLKPSRQFFIGNSGYYSQVPLTVAPVLDFDTVVATTHYATGSQVVWQGDLYECTGAHTWSPTSSITPASQSYWSATPSYVSTTYNFALHEVLSQGDIYLPTNKVLFQQAWTQSGYRTISAARAGWSDELVELGAKMEVSPDGATFSQIWHGSYLNFNIWQTGANGLTGAPLGGARRLREKQIALKEPVLSEVGCRANERHERTVYFKDLDTYGAKIVVNGEVMHASVSTEADMEQTIDSTLVAWVGEYSQRLSKLGIYVRAEALVEGGYKNCLSFVSDYPNVPFDLSVQVGTTGAYEILDTFFTLSQTPVSLSLSINNRAYGVTFSQVESPQNIIAGWVSANGRELSDRGILAQATGRTLRLSTLTNEPITLTPNIFPAVGQNNLPVYEIVRKKLGQLGAVMASNAVKLPTSGTWSFFDEPFSTGRIVSVNNTAWPYMNREYNILNLVADRLVFSYEGPYWNTSTNGCQGSPFVTLAFGENSFATASCPTVGGFATGGLGPYSPTAFSGAFSTATASENYYYYQTNAYGTGNGGFSLMVDKVISVNSPHENIYALGSSGIGEISTKSLKSESFLSATGTGPVLGGVYDEVSDRLFVANSTGMSIISGDGSMLLATVSCTAPKVVAWGGSVSMVSADSGHIRTWGATNFGPVPTMLTALPANGVDIAHIDGLLICCAAGGRLLGYRKSDMSTVYDLTHTGATGPLYSNNSTDTVYYGAGGELFALYDGSTYSTGLTYSGDYRIYSDLTNGVSYFSTNGRLSALSATATTVDVGFPYICEMGTSDVDGYLYAASKVSDGVYLFDKDTLAPKAALPYGGYSKAVLKNGYRGSMVSFKQDELVEIVAQLPTVVQVGETLGATGGERSPFEDSRFGHLSDNYVDFTGIWVSAREHIRKPRANYEGEPDIKLVWKWETDDNSDFILFDPSGDRLPTTGSQSYLGERPLPIAVLNKNYNTLDERRYMPEYQKTVFDELDYTLSKIDDEEDLGAAPSPLQAFVAYASQNEGPSHKNLLLLKKHGVDFTIMSDDVTKITFELIKDPIGGDYGKLKLPLSSEVSFVQAATRANRGLKKGQRIKLYIYDTSNSLNKYLSPNHGKVFKVRHVSNKVLEVDLISDALRDGSSVVNDWPTIGRTAYLSVRIKTEDDVVAKFRNMGQTETEDERFRIELSNTGHLVTSEDQYIFKTTDVLEQGADWALLNAKRKEMLANRHEIFPYVGSYKSLINAINFFGWNDLHLYEYYRNIDPASPDFFKLAKVEIPDIFDNTVEGWKENDFITGTMPNDRYETTNLFNLTFRITDFEGNNVLPYSLSDAMQKLSGLKKWLQRKIVPITHRILDITGRADSLGTGTIEHRNFDVVGLRTTDELSPVEGRLSQAYRSPINGGSPIYNCYAQFECSGTSSVPDMFDVTIRTWQKHPEWEPFRTYSKGDRVSYYSNVWESETDGNATNNPRAYDNVADWSATYSYTLGQKSIWGGSAWEWSATYSTFDYYTSSVPLDPASEKASLGGLSNWDLVSSWKKRNLSPVQTIKRTYYGVTFSDMAFTVDTFTDPLVTVEVSSTNGYGAYYKDIKHYVISPPGEQADPLRGEPNGPFVPIRLIENTIQ